MTEEIFAHPERFVGFRTTGIGFDMIYVTERFLEMRIAEGMGRR